MPLTKATPTDMHGRCGYFSQRYLILLERHFKGLGRAWRKSCQNHIGVELRSPECFTDQAKVNLQSQALHISATLEIHVT